MDGLVQDDENLLLIDRNNSVDLASTSSGLSSVFSSDFDIPSATSSDDLSAEISRLHLAEPPDNKCVVRGNKGATWGFTSVIGRLAEMEDAVAVVPEFMSTTCHQVGGCRTSKSSGEIISPLHFFGVYDGHGGSQVAKLCAKRMHAIVADEWEQTATEDPDQWRRRWESSLRSGFERADREVQDQDDAVALARIGSTAVVIVLSCCQIISANCGDSRAVLCRETETIQLTVDHKPDRADELLRIEEKGGKVFNWDGARLFGVLAMSRAIGDHYLRPWIIPVPEITFTTRRDEDECLILASDGLWDVMTNEEVGEVARRVLRSRQRFISADGVSPAQFIADHLTEIALARNSSDNISVIVVDLKSKRTRQPKRSKH